jgi:hypothetical protein
MDAARGPDPSRGGARAARAAVLALVALALGSAAHVVGGGVLPGPVGLVGLFLGLGGGAALVTSRRLRPALLVGWLGAAQAGSHLVLSALAAPSVPAVPSLAGLSGFASQHATGHLHGLSPAALDHAGAVAGPSGLFGHDGAVMLAAHAVATVLTALALARGDALWWLLRSLGPALPRPSWRLPGPVPALTIGAPTRRPTRRWPAQPHPRGPPVVA